MRRKRIKMREGPEKPETRLLYRRLTKNTWGKLSARKRKIKEPKEKKRWIPRPQLTARKIRRVEIWVTTT
jgi:hypothetical protein